ncbi:MAG: hypothetical protein R3Y05_06470 [bacterium]
MDKIGELKVVDDLLIINKNYKNNSDLHLFATISFIDNDKGNTTNVLFSKF